MVVDFALGLLPPPLSLNPLPLHFVMWKDFHSDEMGTAVNSFFFLSNRRLGPDRVSDDLEIQRQ